MNDILKSLLTAAVVIPGGILLVLTLPERKPTPAPPRTKMQVAASEYDKAIRTQQERNMAEYRAADAHAPQLWDWVKHKITNTMRSPSTVSFGDQGSDHVAYLVEYQRYFVKGWVDSMNGFGGIVRTEYSFLLYYTPGHEPEIDTVYYFRQR